MSLKRNLFYNVLSNLISKLVRVSEQLLLIPFFITSWGAAYYGEWLTLTIIPSVIAFSDMGFGTAAGNKFVLYYVGGSFQKALNISKTGKYLITFMVIFAIVLSVFSLGILSYFGVFEKSLIDKYDGIAAVSILILARLTSFYSQLFESYYRAARKAALSINLITVRGFLNLIVGVLVLKFEGTIVDYAISQLIVALVFNISFGFYGRSLLPIFKDFKGVFVKEEQKEITRKGFGFLMSPIWQVIYFQGTTFIVRIVLGPESVAIFNTVRTLSRSVNQLYTIVNSSVFPELQYELGAGNLEKAQKLFRLSVFSVFIVSIFGFIFLAIFGLQAYSIWTDNQLEVSNIFWSIMISGILFNALWWSAGVVFSALNKPKMFAIFGVCSAIISVISTYFLTLKFGLIGSSIGYLLLDIFMIILVLPYSCKLMSIRTLDLFKNGLSDSINVIRLINNKFNSNYKY